MHDHNENAVEVFDPKHLGKKVEQNQMNIWSYKFKDAHFEEESRIKNLHSNLIAAIILQTRHLACANLGNLGTQHEISELICK